MNKSSPVEKALFKSEAHAARLYRAILSSNEVLRSMASIADREGKDTGWRWFKVRLRKELLRQHRIMYPQQYRKHAALASEKGKETP